MNFEKLLCYQLQNTFPVTKALFTQKLFWLNESSPLILFITMGGLIIFVCLKTDFFNCQIWQIFSLSANWWHWCLFAWFVLLLGVTKPHGSEKPTQAAVAALVGLQSKMECPGTIMFASASDSVISPFRNLSLASAAAWTHVYRR